MRSLKTLLLVLLVLLVAGPGLAIARTEHVITSKKPPGVGKYDQICMFYVEREHKKNMPSAQRKLASCIKYQRRYRLPANVPYTDERIGLQFCGQDFQRVRNLKVRAHFNASQCKGGADGYCNGWGCKQKPR